MEAIVERENLKKALAQVQRNKGAPGIDGMSFEDLAPYLKEHWPTIRAQLLDGSYKPQPVRRVEIPKPTGGTRPLGIPTVLDRFIQQAAMQVLQAEWDRTFSEHSFGFRPKRSAHQGVARAQEYIACGHDGVVDLDLEKFFDRVNHDILMGLVAKRVTDKRILRLIRSFLTAGVLEGGLVSPTEGGTPQGGPLSPLLSNLMLDVLDKELVSSDGAATLASARPHQCCIRWIDGSDGGCVPSFGSSGSACGRALRSCDAAASAGSWRGKPPAAHMALGGSATARRLLSPCRMLSSLRWTL
jgi:group II intron reverse transcriptase/maturase